MGKVKIYYVTFLFFVTIYTILYDTYSLFLLSLTVFFFPIILWCCGRWIKKSISLSYLGSNYEIRKGMTFVQKICIKNSSILPAPRVTIALSVFYEFGEELKEEVLHIMVPARGDRVIGIKMRCDYCGFVLINIKKVFVYDFLGIWKFRIAPLEGISFAILPNLYEVPRFILGRSYGELTGGGEISNSVGDDLSEIFGYRNYQCEDQLNRVDWKLSAKHRQLIVKEYSKVSDHQTLLFFDAFSVRTGDRLYELDAAIELLYAVSHVLLCQQGCVIIYWYDDVKKCFVNHLVDSMDALDTVLRSLYRLSTSLGNERAFCDFCAFTQLMGASDIFYLGYYKQQALISSIRRVQPTAFLHIMCLMRKDDERPKNEIAMDEGIFLHDVAVADLRNGVLALKEEWEYEDRTLKKER